MTIANFFTSIDASFLTDVLGLGIFAWVAGYGAGYVLAFIRRVANQST